MEHFNRFSMNVHLSAHVRKSKRIVIKSSHQKTFIVVRMNCTKHYCPEGLPRANVYHRSSVLLMKYSATQAHQRSCSLPFFSVGSFVDQKSFDKVHRL